MMKKILAVVLAAVLCIGLLGCGGGKKEAATADRFKEVAAECGMTVENAKDIYTDKIFVDSYLATAPSGWQAVFFLIDTADNAHTYFDTMLAFVEGQKTGAGSAQTTKRDTWATYTQTNGGKFAYVSQIEGTMLYIAPTDADANKAAAEEFIKKLGY